MEVACVSLECHSYLQEIKIILGGESGPSPLTVFTVAITAIPLWMSFVWTSFAAPLTKWTLEPSLTRRCLSSLGRVLCLISQPSNHVRVQTFHPEEKELVFDIDATDYKDVIVTAEEYVRFSLSVPLITRSEYITSLTWPLMAVTIETLDNVLRTDFGFRTLRWS